MPGPLAALVAAPALAKVITSLVMASRPAKKAMKRFTGKMQTIFGRDGGKVVSTLAMMAIGNYTSSKISSAMGGPSSGAGSGEGGTDWLDFGLDFLKASGQVSDATKGSDRGTPDMNIPQGGQDYTDALPRSLGIANGFGYNFDGSIMNKATDIYGASQGAGTRQNNDGTLSNWLDIGLKLYRLYSDQRASKKAAEEEKQRKRRELLQQLSGAPQVLSGEVTTPETAPPQTTDVFDEIWDQEEYQSTIPPKRTGPLPPEEEEEEGIDWGEVWERAQDAGQKVLDASMEGVESGARQKAEDTITGREDPKYIADIQRGSFAPTPITTPQQLQFQAAPYVQHAQAAAFDPNVYARYMTTVGSI